jgi:hypothetical protein
MSDTKYTLVQPPEDPKELAKQTFIMVQHLFHTVQDMSITVQSIDIRLTSVESTVQSMNVRLSSLELTAVDLKDRIVTLETIVQHVGFTVLEAKIDDQAKETNQISSKLDKLIAEVESIKAEVKDLKEVKLATHKLDKKLSNINLELAEQVIKVNNLEDNLVKQ